jgi:transglutaminase-like putative cysteine protease
MTVDDAMFVGERSIMRAMLLFIILLSSSALRQVPADSSVVHFGQPPAWTLPAPRLTRQSAPDGPAVRFVYSDAQTRIGPDGTENFFAYKVKIVKPEGLPVGNVTVTWNPAAGSITVHRLNIVRDGEVTDVLKSTRFRVLEREGGLEQAMLDGQLTAAIQAPGLRVGDELEFAVTISQQDRTLGNHAYGIAQMPVVGQPGTFRVRVIWPASHALKWKATNDLADIAPKTTGGQTELLYEVGDLKSALITDNAPDRFNLRRQIEYSDYGSWAELSRQVWSLYDTAARLTADSPLHQEAAKIAAQSPDPATRAVAALQLVQEQIRYVYVGLVDGNFRPATADETWNRRFGDCKAKTALLLALLRELGVPAEAALVNAEGGDGMDARLPNPSLFNHVVVHTTIGAKSYWLDGTRLGNRSLANLPTPNFRWALPVRPNDVSLLAVPLEPPQNPQVIDIVDLDATAGVDRPATIKVQQILRGEEAAEYRAVLSSLPSEGAERALKNYWIQNGAWGLPNAVAWRYDEEREALVFSMTTEEKLDWTGTNESGWSLTIPGAGFMPPAELKRPKEQDQTAPWKTEFPRFHCWVTAIRLPAAAPAWIWSYRAAPVDRNLGGVGYWRTADLRANVMRTIMSKRFYLPELSAADAAEVNAAIAGFDNKMSQVYQVRATQSGGAASTVRPPFDEKTNWLESTALCSSPTLGGK